MRLTQPRLAMLRQLASAPGYYAAYYPPMRWALDQDHAEETDKGQFRLTASGRAILAEAEKK